jgi:uncharacterized protein
MAGRFEAIFESGSKPIIAMAHLPALPGAPLHDSDHGVDGLVEWVAHDMEILLRHPFDAVMFCNENDRPWKMKADPVDIAVMTRVINELRPTDRPFGVDYLWDARASLAIAVATGAQFMREVLPGTFESDFGMYAPDTATLLRERRWYGGDDIAIFMNVMPEFASTIGHRSAGRRARSAAVSSLADAILVSGPMASETPDARAVEEIVEAVDGRAPVLLNTGSRHTSVSQFLRVVDGVVVGSDLKVDGFTWNQVDEARVKRFLAAARES